MSDAARQVQRRNRSIGMWVQLNGEIVPESEARVSVFDRGFTYGDGVFETFRTYNGRGFLIDSHFQRLARAAAALRFRLPRSAGEMSSDVERVLERNGLSDAVVRVHVSRGIGGRGPAIEGVHDPTYVVAAWPVPTDLDERRVRGARLSTVSVRRSHPLTLPAVAKLANYLNSVLAVAEAAAEGCDGAVMLTTDGFVAETGTANIFFVNHGVLCTPAVDLGVIPGVTRRLVLEIADHTGVRTREGRFEPAALAAAGEIFLTNSVVGIQPVATLDGRRHAVPGDLTRQLSHEYGLRVSAETGGRH